MQVKTLGIVLLVATFFTAPEATAQPAANTATPCARASRIESNVPCDDAGEGRTSVITHELEVTTRIEGVTIPTRQCQAEVSLSYFQKNTLASVDGEIVNPTCAASSGSLVLSVRTRDANGAETTQEFTQEWMRDDDQPVLFSAEYPIGENTDLTRVRALRIRCMCAEAQR